MFAPQPFLTIDIPQDIFWSGEFSPAATLRIVGPLRSPAVSPITRVLHRGDYGPDVATWQARLVELTFDPGQIDGIFGVKTRTATTAFQRSKSITADGDVGPATIAAAWPSREVSKTRTPLTTTQLVEALREAHASKLDVEPSRKRLACAWAQIAIENARGWAIWCNNLGNITAFDWPGSYYTLIVRERVSRKPDVWRDVHLRFRAHPNPDDGAGDYWSLISNARYAPALALFDAGKPREAAYKLSELGYYTAHAEPYARAMAELYDAFPG